MSNITTFLPEIYGDHPSSVVSFANYDALRAQLENGLQYYNSCTYSLDTYDIATENRDQLKQIKKVISDKKKALEEGKTRGMTRAAIHTCNTGFLDQAGFRKDSFWLFQSRWRPELPMAHILPHWNWKEREGLVTPVYVFTSGDEGELFLNGRSLGRQRKQPGVWDRAYRLRWDDVVYEPGELKVVAYGPGGKAVWYRKAHNVTACRN